MKDELVAALMKEIRMQAGYLEGDRIGTIYFGGGTPSALPPDDITRIQETIYSVFDISPAPEITLEANPEDIHHDSLGQWMASGINRLSIGVQAFQDPILQKWNRSHDAQQAHRSILLAQDAGITNITADLIYGDPELSDAAWEYNIRTLIDTGIPHISSYALTVEEKTALAYQILKGQRQPVDEEKANRQYAILQTMLMDAGFEQYEVSNFAKAGFISRHNSNYWSGAYYLGIGPSAHSYNGMSRQWNVANNIRYLQSMEEGTIPFETETLSPSEIYNETIMTGLRTAAGIDAEKIRSLGNEYESYFLEQVKPYLEAGKIWVKDQRRYCLRPEYYFFADGMASSMFLLPTP